METADQVTQIFVNRWLDIDEKVPASEYGPEISTPTIQVKLDDGAYLPVRAHGTDAGADIMTPRGLVIPPFGWATIHTGVHVETPHGHATILKSKSGLNVKRHITSTGVIDEGYDGEIVVRLYNHSPFFRRFRRGDKVTQMIVVKVMYADFAQVNEIGGGDRGSSGFGSSGR